MCSRTVAGEKGGGGEIELGPTGIGGAFKVQGHPRVSTLSWSSAVGFLRMQQLNFTRNHILYSVFVIHLHELGLRRVTP